MKALLVSVLIMLLASPTWACKPVAFAAESDIVRQTGRWVPQNRPLRPEELRLKAEFATDEARFYELRTQTEAVCTDRDANSCVMDCVELTQAELAAAPVIEENGYRYAVPAKQRAVLKKQMEKLEAKWVNHQ